MTKLYKKIVNDVLFKPTVGLLTVAGLVSAFYGCDNSDKVVEAINNNNKELISHMDSLTNSSTEKCYSAFKDLSDGMYRSASLSIPIPGEGDSVFYGGLVFNDSLTNAYLQTNDRLRKDADVPSSYIKEHSKKSSNNGGSSAHKKHYVHHKSHHKKKGSSTNTASNSGAQSTYSPSQNQAPALSTDSLNKLVNGVYQEKQKQNVNWMEVTLTKGSYDKSNYNNN